MDYYMQEEFLKENKDYNIFLCHNCGKTIIWTLPNSCSPNLICQCEMPDHMNIMHKVYDSTENKK